MDFGENCQKNFFIIKTLFFGFFVPKIRLFLLQNAKNHKKKIISGKKFCRFGILRAGTKPAPKYKSQMHYFLYFLVRFV